MESVESSLFSLPPHPLSSAFIPLGFDLLYWQLSKIALNDIREGFLAVHLTNFVKRKVEVFLGLYGLVYCFPPEGPEVFVGAQVGLLVKLVSYTFASACSTRERYGRVICSVGLAPGWHGSG